MEIASLIASGASGGLFGIIGSLSGRLIGIWETREKRKDQAAAYNHEINLINLQRQQRAEETEQELSIMSAELDRVRVAGSYEGLAASIEAQTKAQDGVSAWVKDVLALIRPAITVVLLIAMIVCVWWLKAYGLSPQTFDALVVEWLYCLNFAAMTALFWWFGDRVPTMPGKMGGSR